MSKNRARNNTIVHPRKRSNANDREKQAMAMAKRIRKTVASMKATHVGPEAFRHLIEERVSMEVACDTKCKDFWRLVGKHAFKILISGKDMT